MVSDRGDRADDLSAFIRAQLDKRAAEHRLEWGQYLFVIESDK